MSTVYVVWGYTDNDDEDSKVLGIFSNIHLAEQRLFERDGNETWASQSITAYELNLSRSSQDDELGRFIRRVECKDLPLTKTEEDVPDGA